MTNSIPSEFLLGELGIYTAMDKFSKKERRKPESPNFLYKYKSVNLNDKKSIEYTRQLLLEEEIHCSHPENLNDINDLRFELSFTKDKQLIQNYFNTQGNHLLKNLPASKRFDIKRRFLYGQPSETDKEKLQDEFRQNSSLFCCTDDPRNELMWAHYGDNHHGICIQLHRHNDLALSHLLNKVEYSDKFPSISFPLTGNSQKEYYLNKSKAWFYEREYRLFFAKPSFNLKLSKNTIRSVIVGAKHKKELVDFLISVNQERINKKLLPVNIFKATRKKHSYGIQINSIRY